MQLLRRSVDKWGSRDFFQFLKWSNLLAITCRQKKSARQSLFNNRGSLYNSNVNSCFHEKISDIFQIPFSIVPTYFCLDDANFKVLLCKNGRKIIKNVAFEVSRQNWAKLQ